MRPEARMEETNIEMLGKRDFDINQNWSGFHFSASLEEAATSFADLNWKVASDLVPLADVGSPPATLSTKQQLTFDIVMKHYL